MSSNTELTSKDFPLGINGYTYADLYQPLRLRDLQKTFEDSVQQHDEDLFTEFQEYQSCQGENMPPQIISDLLVRMAPYVGKFVATLFQVEDEVAAQSQAIREEVDTIFVYRTELVGKLKSKFKNENTSTWDIEKIQSDLELLKTAAFPIAANDPDAEKSISRVGAKLARLANHYQLNANDKPKNKDILWHLDDADEQVSEIRKSIRENTDAKITFKTALSKDQAADFINSLLDVVQRWSYAAQNDDELSKSVVGWVSFKNPEKTDSANLVHHETKQRDGFTTWVGPENDRRRRDGFALTDPRFNTRQTLYEVDHCIYCHDRDTDSCSKGMRNKKTGDFKSTDLGITITGCPLEEKISEMHILKKEGDNIGALALIVIDNPMCPGTGHRICNECMKGCIYQKTEPVDIPQIETNVLTDILFMPWGFEIYSLLTRWNPLNVKRPHALPYNGKNTLVVGLGPAGYTLSHYLINEGFGVVGIDGLKIEPLPDELTGANGHTPTPVKDFSELYEDLDKRLLAGFGGVAEYGITVR